MFRNGILYSCSKIRLYFLSFVLLLSVEAGIDPLSWGLFRCALIIVLFFHLIFLAAQSLCKIPCGLESSKRFCSMKALTSIQELANCTVKGWLMVLVLWIQKKGSFAQLRLKGSELHVQTQFYFLGSFVVLRKKKSNFAIRLFWGPMLPYIIMFKPLLLSCNEVLSMSFFCLIFWRVNCIYWPDFHIFFCSWDSSSTGCYLMWHHPLKTLCQK